MNSQAQRSLDRSGRQEASVAPGLAPPHSPPTPLLNMSAKERAWSLFLKNVELSANITCLTPTK